MVKMRFAEVFGDCYSERSLTLVKQLGCNDVIGHGPNTEGEVWKYQDLAYLKKRVEEFGLRLDTLEDGPKIDKIMLGLPGQEEQLENFCRSLENLGRAGIKTIKPQHMPPGWESIMTTSESVTRGGATSRAFDYDLVKDKPPTKHGLISEEQTWRNLRYFLEGALPTAEAAGVRISLHPDDPPISPIQGFARILRSVEAFDKMLEIYPSPNIGLLFCQGCFAEMGVDIPSTIRHFGKRGKIFFAHFRDVLGAVPRFQEVFHGEGPTNMFEAMKTYYDVGFEGPIRPDHAPKLEGDELYKDGKMGYYLLGKIYALGYMRGLAESVEKTYRFN